MAEAAVFQKSEKFLKMTTAPVEKLILGLAGPSITIMIISALYNMTDTYFVATLGTSQVAAVGIAFPLMAVFQAIGFFFGVGSGNYISRTLGAQNTEAASRMAVTALVSGFFFMSLVALTGLIGLGPLVNLLRATETIKPHAMEYIYFILLASPWMVAATILNQQLRFQGSAAIAMVGMVSGAILNIFLDFLFIIVFGLGVRGAAIATMLCQMTSFFILFFYGTTRKGTIRITFSHFSPAFSRYWEMFRGGVPSLLRQGLMSLSTVIIYHFAKPYGDAAIAAISIVQRLCMFAFSAVLGFGQGFQPVCGFNYGAKLYSRVKRSFWFCIRFCSIGLLIICLAMIIFAPQIIALFRKDDLEVIAIGARGLRFNCTSLPFMVIVVICNMMTQTMGRALEASILATTRQGLFLIPCLFVLGPLLGLLGIQLCTMVADMASLIVAIPILIRVLKSISLPDGELR